MVNSNEYNPDELNPPLWLDNEFFQRALRNFYKDNFISVKNVVTRPGTKIGEHYASCMYRAEVTYENKEKLEKIEKLILKTLPTEDGPKLEMLKASTAFETEMRMYGEVLPAMEKLLKSVGDETRIAPTLVYQSNEPVPVIIFIDECLNGFKSFEKPLNLEQTKVLCERIAKFHACSVYLNENGLDLTTFKDCPYIKVEGRMNFLSLWIMPNMIDSFETMKKWKGIEKYLPVLERFYENFEKNVEKLFRNPQKAPYRILIHGDLGYKNMIYRNDGTKSDDFLLLDFQFSYFNGPAMDILSLLYNCTNHEMRKNHRQEVIHEYFRIFIETLKKFEYKGRFPTLLDLQTEILRCGILEFMVLIVLTPWQYVDFSTLNMNVSDMSPADLHAITKKVFDVKEYQDLVMDRVKYLTEMGVFE
ncbi:uncharacterized protein LOC134837694 [Culicoides brevitarsis]|uniref:uncharacterized protein LOC134837694 n=1 Tax=Culicoides brevitarsis TaxID=469753 RepID=UPI00307B8DF2